MKSILLLLVAASCSADAPDPHELAACTYADGFNGSAWSGQCEAACVEEPVGWATNEQTGPLCRTAEVTCHSITWNGITGCCIARSGAQTAIEFKECL